MAGCLVAAPTAAPQTHEPSRTCVGLSLPVIPPAMWAGRPLRLNVLSSSPASRTNPAADLTRYCHRARGRVKRESSLVSAGTTEAPPASNRPWQTPRKVQAAFHPRQGARLPVTCDSVIL